MTLGILRPLTVINYSHEILPEVGAVRITSPSGAYLLGLLVCNVGYELM